MRPRSLLGGLIAVGSAILIVCAGMGAAFPVEVLFNLAIGWAFYGYRVLPQVRPSTEGILTALVCLGGFAIGLHVFLRWLHHQFPTSQRADGETVRLWPVHRTLAIVGLVVLMFVAGISAVGMSHQTAWLLTSPEKLTEGGIRRYAARSSSANNLHQMAIAMHDYHDAYGTLPPAASYDREGQPLLSWRVLILPYVEQGNLFKKFRLDEAWDSPHNLRWLPYMPKIYASPLADGSSAGYRTPYQVFTGKGTAFEGRKGLRISRDFPDDTSNTILIVEAAETVPWTKPQDLPYHPADPLPALGFLEPNFFQAAMADGSVHPFKRAEVTEQGLRARITRNGG